MSNQIQTREAQKNHEAAIMAGVVALFPENSLWERLNIWELFDKQYEIIQVWG